MGDFRSAKRLCKLHFGAESVLKRRACSLVRSQGVAGVWVALHLWNARAMCIRKVKHPAKPRQPLLIVTARSRCTSRYLACLVEFCGWLA